MCIYIHYNYNIKLLVGLAKEVICYCSATQSCLTLCDPMDCSPSAPLSVGFFRQEYYSGLPFPPPGNLPDPGIKPMYPALQAISCIYRWILNQVSHQGILWYTLFMYKVVLNTENGL